MKLTGKELSVMGKQFVKYNILHSSATNILGWTYNNIIGDVGKFLGQYYKPEYNFLNLSGQGSGDVAKYHNNGYNFYIIVHMPTIEDIKAIDNFFEAYGYRVDRWGKINLKVRDTFTFIKCNDVQIKSTSNRASGQLRNMLVNGCRFWNTEIGEYNV